MRVSSILAVLALALVNLNGAAWAQNPVNPQGAPKEKLTRVCLIDVAYIFDKHPLLKQKIEGIDEQAKAALEIINKKREEIVKSAEGLSQFKEGSPEFKQLEEKLANAESQLKLEFMRKEKEFAETKAKVIYDTYIQVQGTIELFAKANWIDVVMRFSREEMDPKKPQTISSGINRNIVYYNPEMDMTDGVLKYIIDSTPQLQAGNRPNQPGSTQPAQPGPRTGNLPPSGSNPNLPRR